MQFNTKEELYEELKKRPAEKIIVLPATDIIIVVGFYNGSSLIDSLVAIKENDKWEIIEGEKSRKTSYLYISYFGSLIGLLENKLESDDMFKNELLN